ncbi:hypothetical protein D3C80_1956240 [compost metagenome]
MQRIVYQITYNHSFMKPGRLDRHIIHKREHAYRGGIDHDVHTADHPLNLVHSDTADDSSRAFIPAGLCQLPGPLLIAVGNMDRGRLLMQQR